MWLVWCFAMTARLWLPTAPDDLAKKEMDKLQGTWQLVLMEHDGVKEPSEKTKYVQHTFKGDQVTNTKAFSVNGVPQGPGGTVVNVYSIDATKTPKFINVTSIEVDGDEVPWADQQTIEAVYSLEGDTLTVYGCPPGRPRPKGLEEGPGVFHLVLKRVK